MGIENFVLVTLEKSLNGEKNVKSSVEGRKAHSVHGFKIQNNSWGSCWTTRDWSN